MSFLLIKKRKSYLGLVTVVEGTFANKKISQYTAAGHMTKVYFLFIPIYSYVTHSR